MAFLMLASSTGFAFNVHYCGGSIAAVSLKYAAPTIEKKLCCSEEATTPSRKCCSDKVVKLKEKTDEVLSKIFSITLDIQLSDIWNPSTRTSVEFPSDTAVLPYYCDAHAPPLFKLYNQYIFYA